jgi:hypothetical protein
MLYIYTIFIFTMLHNKHFPGGNVFMGEKFLNPQEVIIKELIDRSDSDRIYDLSTLQFLSMHTPDINHQLHSLSCFDLNGEQHWFYMVIVLERGYWDIDLSWGYTPLEQAQLLEFQNLPWASLASIQTGKGLTEPSFYAFGEVIEKDLPIKTVQLVSANGLILEDWVEQGLVLFVKDDILAFPIWAELYDEIGTCVNRHLLWDISERSPLVDEQ